MQAQTGKLVSHQATFGLGKNALINLVLYEEFSGKEIAETIRTRLCNYETASCIRRRELEEEADAEIEDFFSWLEKTKGLDRTAAHYCAVSLKSLLLGLPMGVQIAQIFNEPLKNLLYHQGGRTVC